MTNVDMIRATLRGLARGWRFRAAELGAATVAITQERLAFLAQVHDYAFSPAGQLAACPIYEIGGITDRCYWTCGHKDCPAHAQTQYWVGRLLSVSKEHAAAIEAANDAEAASEVVLVPYSAADDVLRKHGVLRSACFLVEL